MIVGNLRIALKSISSNKLRSFLTLLGIVIGIYAVVTLLSIARGVQKQTTELVEGFGPTTIVILPGEQIERGSPNIVSQFAPSTLFSDDVDYLINNAKYLTDKVDYVVFSGGVLRRGETKSGAFTFGATTGIRDLWKMVTVEGRDMNEEDLLSKSPLIFLDEKSAKNLNVKIGDKLTYGATAMTLTGIFRLDSNMSLSFGGGSSGFAYFPATLAQEINQSKQINRIIVRANNVDNVDRAKLEIKQLLSQKHGAEDFTVLLPTDILDSFNQITDILTYLVIGIASISLLVGGVGISNIMLVTVTERTREIGIRKSVGATEGIILTQFLIEAVILTTVGALIGIILAWATGLVAARLTPVEPILNWQTIILALAMGFVAGIVFGLFPAIRAARKNPVEALRFE